MFKNRAFQVTLVKKNKSAATHPNDISEEGTSLDPNDLAEIAQNLVTTSALTIGAVVAGVVILKTGCKLVLLTAESVLK